MDVLALYVAAVVCLVVFVVRTVRADAQADTITDPDRRGWLLVAAAIVCVIGATALAVSRLFGG